MWNLILVTILTKIQVRKKIKFHEKMYFILYILLFFSGKVGGSLETKYKCKDYGLTFTEKWSVDNKLATTVELADKPVKGAKVM